MDEIYFSEVYPDYGITKNGITYSRRTGKIKEKSQYIDKFGYINFQFYQGKKLIIKRVHVFLWECYYHDYYPFTVHIRPIHIDGNKMNNTISNLKMYINTSKVEKMVRKMEQEKLNEKKPDYTKPLKIMEILPASYANFFFSMNEIGRDHLYKKIKNRKEMMKPWEVEDIFKDELRFFRKTRN